MSTPLDHTPGGQVTIADLFRVMNGIQLDLREALTKLQVIDTRNVGADEIQRDHEVRLRQLEAFKYRILGAATFGASVAGALAGWLAAVIHK